VKDGDLATTGSVIPVASGPNFVRYVTLGLCLLLSWCFVFQFIIISAMESRRRWFQFLVWHDASFIHVFRSRWLSVHPPLQGEIRVLYILGILSLS
jgi:hypothetical protein